MNSVFSSKMLPSAFFLMDVSRLALITSLEDCEYAKYSRTEEMMKESFLQTSRALDNYSTLQITGWYFVLDPLTKGLIKEHKLRGNFIREVRLRQSVLDELEHDGFMFGEKYKKWFEFVKEMLSAEEKLLKPFESKFRPEISSEILVNAGNDWEWFLGFVLVQLEMHRKHFELIKFVMDLQTCAMVETDLLRHLIQIDRIWPIIKQNLSQDMFEKIVSVGFRDFEAECEHKNTSPLARIKTVSVRKTNVASRSVTTASSTYSISELFPRFSSRSNSGSSPKTESIETVNLLV
mmetsp:Transcript_9638/g.17366  ORF Transcript_9638/g.17366 Transcript_9638/m.17366 type:complete len:292 (-) Transcript_9638:583-1458(-)